MLLYKATYTIVRTRSLSTHRGHQVYQVPRALLELLASQGQAEAKDHRGTKEA